MATPWVNWLGNQQAMPEAIVAPRDVAGVVDVVQQVAARRQRLRVLAGGYSWSPLVPVDGTLLSMANLKQIRHIDTERCQVTVEPGAPLFDVVVAAAARGLSLKSPAMFLGLTIGGLIATGSHGTGRHASTLGDSVIAFELVKPDGSVLHVTEPGSELWRAVMTNLGALGVLTSVTLQCEPLYNVLEMHQKVPYQDTASLIPAMVRDHEFVSVFWSPAGSIANFKLGNRTTRPAVQLKGRLYPTWHDRSGAITGRYLPRLAEKVPRLAEAMAAAISAGIGTGSQVVREPDFSHYQQIYPPVISSEFAIPVEHAAEAWAWIVQRLMQYWRSGIRPVDLVVHARFGSASQALLASASGRATCHLEVLCLDGNPHRELFATDFDQKMRRDFAGRPHWGKDIANPWRAAQTWSHNVEQFLEIRHQLDPQQTFLNPFLRDQVFSLGRRLVRGYGSGGTRTGP
jgi:FAD/FMN-containing dehydrogenase